MDDKVCIYCRCNSDCQNKKYVVVFYTYTKIAIVIKLYYTGKLPIAVLGTNLNILLYKQPCSLSFEDIQVRRNILI